MKNTPCALNKGTETDLEKKEGDARNHYTPHPTTKMTHHPGKKGGNDHYKLSQEKNLGEFGKKKSLLRTTKSKEGSELLRILRKDSALGRGSLIGHSTTLFYEGVNSPSNQTAKVKGIRVLPRTFMTDEKVDKARKRCDTLSRGKKEFTKEKCTVEKKPAIRTEKELRIRNILTDGSKQHERGRKREEA